MRPRGFALAEAAVLVVVISCILALLLVLGAEHRRHGRLGEDMGKLRTIASLTSEYAADNEDMFWTFSWRTGYALSKYPDLNGAGSDLEAQANQAVDILRRRAGREDMPRMTSWFPHASYSHLPLLDHAQRVPDELFISAADTNRLKWSRDPLGFDAGVYVPAPPGAPGSAQGKRWPYSGSFQLSTAFFDRSDVANRVYQGANHTTTVVPGNAVLSARQQSDAAYPAHKVLLGDSNARHFGTRQPFATHNESRLPLLFADGSALVKAATESNPGWIPSSPTSGASTSFLYQPGPWEPSTFSGSTAETVTGRFRWTRGYLLGRDFFGPEACTGQTPAPGCP